MAELYDIVFANGRLVDPETYTDADAVLNIDINGNTIAGAILKEEPLVSTMKNAPPVVASTTYAAVPTECPTVETQEWTDIVQGLSWDDDYFDDEDGVVAVFDFDYDKISRYLSRFGWFWFTYSLLTAPLIYFVPDGDDEYDDDLFRFTIFLVLWVYLFSLGLCGMMYTWMFSSNCTGMHVAVTQCNFRFHHTGPNAMLKRSVIVRILCTLFGTFVLLLDRLHLNFNRFYFV
jgi:hypothetical protein